MTNQETIAHAVRGSDGSRYVCLGFVEAINKARWLAEHHPAVTFAIVELVERHPPEPPGSAWQPIDTAPRDGTQVLTANEDTISVGYYCTHTHKWRDDGDMGWGGMLDVEPTHWKPLPALPENRQADDLNHEVYTAVLRQAEPGAHPEKCPPHYFDPLQESGSGRVCSRCGEQEPRRPAEPAESLRELVNQQAEDDGLWFGAQTAPEAYLQQELRKLHAAIEALADEPASARGIEVSATLAQQAWYHVGQLAVTHPQMFVGEAVREVYRLCGTEPGAELPENRRGD